MKNKLIYTFILILSFLLFSTCKKYPEGGFIKRGPKILLKHNGVWKLTLYEVNGIDSTELINYNGNETYKEVQFFKEGTEIVCTLKPSFQHYVKFLENNNRLYFLNNEEGSIKVCITNSTFFTGCYKMIFNPEGNPCYWDIIKLNSKELILTTNITNRYKIKFKPL